MTTEPQIENVALIAKLIQTQLGIPDDPPRVFTYNTNWDIPSTNDMFVLVSILTDDDFGAGQTYLADPTYGLVEQQLLERATIYTVDLFSVSTEARDRRQEVLFALQGDAAERLMESKSLRIFRPSPFVDISAVEASRRLNRWQTQFAVFEGYGCTRRVPYFNMPASSPAELLVNP